MPGLSRQALLWNQILMIAESMEDPAISAEELQQLLSGLEEGYADAIDPAEEFSEFVALRLCRSVGHILARIR